MRNIKIGIVVLLWSITLASCAKTEESIFINRPSGIISPEALFGLSMDSLNADMVKKELRRNNLYYYPTYIRDIKNNDAFSYPEFYAKQFIGSNVNNAYVSKCVYDFGGLPYDFIDKKLSYSMSIYISQYKLKESIITNLKTALDRYKTNDSEHYKIHIWEKFEVPSSINSVILYEPKDVAKYEDYPLHIRIVWLKEMPVMESPNHHCE
jgi:hypothetical protein